MRVTVHLVDGTYELFRHHFGQPSHRNRSGEEVAAARGVIGSLVTMLERGATHLGVATDRVIESFRNDMWPGYKTGEGVDPDLLAQFGVLEDAVTGLGVLLWPMVELEADDALASAASVAARDPSVDQVRICTPDKDLAQCVVGDEVVQVHRRARKDGGGEEIVNAAAVQAKFGVAPESIPDYLALVGDSADGFPGLPGWGPKSAGTLLWRYGHLEQIPADPQQWEVDVRGSGALAATLAEQADLALLFRDLATLRVEPELLGEVEELRWRGPQPGFAEICSRFDALQLAERAEALAASL